MHISEDRFSRDLRRNEPAKRLLARVRKAWISLWPEARRESTASACSPIYCTLETPDPRYIAEEIDEWPYPSRRSYIRWPTSLT